MGSGTGGLYKGTSRLIDSADIDKLKKKGVKFTEKNVVMTVRDREGNLMWLEIGNMTAGLTHILSGNGKTKGHAMDFEKAFGVSSSQIPAFIKSVILNGKLESSKSSTINGRERIEKEYYVDGKYSLLIGVGTNGFIVSAYPHRDHKEK